MAIVTGLRDTNTIESTILRRDIRSEILQYDANLTPLVVLTASIGGPAGQPGLGSKPTVNPKFEWYEEDRETRRTTTTTTGTGTTITIADGTLAHPDDIWRVTRTAENVKVTSIATNDLTVVRGVGGSAIALVSGDELIRIGNAFQEGADTPAAWSGNPAQKFNYTEIFRKSYAATRTLTQTQNYTTPDDWLARAARAMQEHKLDLESAFWWGLASIDVTGTHPRRTTGGVYGFVSTNKIDMGGTMTETEFFSAYGQTFRYSNPDRVKFGFAARTPVSVIGAFPRGKLEVIQGDQNDTYGVSIMKYRHNLGTLNLVTHNLFSDYTGYAGDIAVVDLLGDSLGRTLVRRRYLEDQMYGSSDTHVRENVQNPGIDGRQDEILTEAGLEMGLERHHAIWTGIQS